MEQQGGMMPRARGPINECSGSGQQWESADLPDVPGCSVCGATYRDVGVRFPLRAQDGGWVTAVPAHSPHIRIRNEQERYYVTPISVGDAGLTQRPAVIDRTTGSTVKVFRRTEEHLAFALAAKLNAEEA